MSERWIPVVAAVLGVLGGMGGAFIGGNVANEGQEQRFHDAQAVRIQDLKREAYAEYVKAGGEVRLRGTLSNIAKINTAQARVSLLTSSPQVRHEAREFRSVALANDASDKAFTRARDEFLDVAHPEITAGV